MCRVPHTGMRMDLWGTPGRSHSESVEEINAAGLDTAMPRWVMPDQSPVGSGRAGVPCSGGGALFVPGNN